MSSESENTVLSPLPSRVLEIAFWPLLFYGHLSLEYLDWLERELRGAGWFRPPSAPFPAAANEPFPRNVVSMRTGA